MKTDEVRIVSTLAMYKADLNDELDRDGSSDEEIFYSTSNEPSRENIDLPQRILHGSQESEPNRDHRSFPRGQKRDISTRCRRDTRDEYSLQLLDSMNRQEKEIKDLETKVRSLRKEVRECFSNLDLKLSSFEVKVDLLVNWFQHPSSDRRCRGFCSKHVRTDKCLCRGLNEPHRCCGHISGVCDC